MEEEFYKYADVQDLAKELNIAKELATSLHRYWTLKRKVFLSFAYVVLQ